MKTCFLAVTNSGASKRIGESFPFANLLLGAFLAAVFSSVCFGADSTGTANLALMVKPEAKLSIQALSSHKTYAKEDREGTRSVEARSREGEEVRWFRAAILARVPNNGSAELRLRNDSLNRYYVTVAGRGDGAVAIAGGGSNAIFTFDKSGQYLVTFGVARSSGHRNEKDLSASLELTSSDGSFHIVQQLQPSQGGCD